MSTQSQNEHVVEESQACGCVYKFGEWKYCTEHAPSQSQNELEVYKPVAEYEGFYEVSNLGNVKSLRRLTRGRIGLKTSNGGIRKPGLTRQGYQVVQLSRDGVAQRKTVHRLVAETFIEQPEGKRVVNHKNGIKTDNRASNLEWCTSSENTIHAYRTGLIKKNIQTHCKRGHPYSPENIYTFMRDGKLLRFCKKCNLINCYERRARLRQQKVPVSLPDNTEAPTGEKAS